MFSQVTTERTKNRSTDRNHKRRGTAATVELTERRKLCGLTAEDGAAAGQGATASELRLRFGFGDLPKEITNRCVFAKEKGSGR